MFELLRLILGLFSRKATTEPAPEPIPAPPEPEIVPEPTSPRQAFFAAVRAKFGRLKQAQVDGFNTLLDAMDGWSIAWQAYGLATAWHETNKTLQPVEEAYWTSDEWRKKHLRYYPWYGRGYVQLTWDYNYHTADMVLGLNGALIADPSLALKPDIAAKILRKGMEEGWFTTHKLADYLPDPLGTERQFELARYIINGSDKYDLIAGYALAFQEALTA